MKVKLISALEKCFLDDDIDSKEEYNRGSCLKEELFHFGICYIDEKLCESAKPVLLTVKSEIAEPALSGSMQSAACDAAEAETTKPELKQELVLSLGDAEITAANAASLSGKLSQMANGAIYDDGGETIRIHDRKLDALEDIIEAANGKPILVAYWFKHDLTRISERLQKLHIPFSRLDDAASIRRWNNGELPVALIHPASAGHGLNLQSGGSAIVWFGLTWSLELYQQTIARLWRQGWWGSAVRISGIFPEGRFPGCAMGRKREKLWRVLWRILPFSDVWKTRSFGWDI